MYLRECAAVHATVLCNDNENNHEFTPAQRIHLDQIVNWKLTNCQPILNYCVCGHIDFCVQQAHYSHHHTHQFVSDEILSFDFRTHM